MRILLLAPHPFFTQRGTPIAEKMLLQVMAAEGHEIDVLTFPEGEDPDISGVRVHRVSAPRGVRPGFSLKKLAGDAAMLGACLARVRKSRYDVVHAVEESVFIALLCKWIFGVPCVYDMDSGLARQMVDRFSFLSPVRFLLDACERLAIRGSCGTLAGCRALEVQARAWHPEGLVAPLEDISFVDSGAAAPAAPADMIPEDWRGDPIVLYVGNLASYQGIDLLLAGFARALPEVPRARLVIMTGREQRVGHYRSLAESLGIAGSVHFTAPCQLEALGACLRQATIQVSPRVHGDNTPMKIFSCMDSGRPLLATRLPTHTQVLDDEVALLVEPDPGAMAKGIVRLLKDEALRERLAANARQLVQRDFTMDAFRRKLLTFYDALEERIGRIGNDGKQPGSTERIEARHQGHG